MNIVIDGFKVLDTVWFFVAYSQVFFGVFMFLFDLFKTKWHLYKHTPCSYHIKLAIMIHDWSMCLLSTKALVTLIFSLSLVNIFRLKNHYFIIWYLFIFFQVVSCAVLTDHVCNTEDYLPLVVSCKSASNHKINSQPWSRFEKFPVSWNGISKIETLIQVCSCIIEHFKWIMYHVANTLFTWKGEWFKGHKKFTYLFVHTDILLKDVFVLAPSLCSLIRLSCCVLSQITQHGRRIKRHGLCSMEKRLFV